MKNDMQEMSLWRVKLVKMSILSTLIICVSEHITIGIESSKQLHMVVLKMCLRQG